MPRFVFTVAMMRSVLVRRNMRVLRVIIWIQEEMSWTQAGQKLQRLPNRGKYAPQNKKSSFSGSSQYLPHAKNGLPSTVPNTDMSLATMKAYTAFHGRQNITANYRTTPVTDDHNRDHLREKDFTFLSGGQNISEDLPLVTKRPSQIQ